MIPLQVADSVSLGQVEGATVKFRDVMQIRPGPGLLVRPLAGLWINPLNPLTTVQTATTWVSNRLRR